MKKLVIKHHGSQVTLLNSENDTSVRLDLADSFLYSDEQVKDMLIDIALKALEGGK